MSTNAFDDAGAGSGEETSAAVRELGIPELCLVVLIGATGSGKSTFAREQFGPYEVLSSDFCRGLVSDDENDQSASEAAFKVLRFIAGQRLSAGKLTVVDATNVQPAARREMVELAKEFDVLPVAIVLDVPEAVCIERNRARSDRDFGDHVVKRHQQLLRKSFRSLSKEGFRIVHTLKSVEEIASVRIVREKLRLDMRDDHGPFDAIGDVHGCLPELVSLLTRLGYEVVRDDQGRAVDAVHPQGRRVIFLGDLVDRGPDSPGVLRLAMGMTSAGHALAVPGNHESKLVRALRGAKVQVSHGLETTLEHLSHETPEFRAQVEQWCYGLISHLVLDDGKLVVAHAGLVEKYQGRTSGRVRSFALYGDTTGETDEYGLPVRLPWATDYRGSATVLYGHTPTPTAEWINNTMCLDTGCVFGGHLTALRYPEREIVDVPAERVWYEPVKPFLVEDAPVLGAQFATDRDPDQLAITDVLGVRSIRTEQLGNISIRPENAAGALEVMSRFALHPRWLRYLPPTMSPVATSKRPDYLEHPEDAFAFFGKAGIERVMCEEKHMGSRAVVLLCRDAQVAARRFGEDEASGGATGAIYTRTGRSSFGPEQTETLLAGVRSAMDSTGLWEELATDWVMFDCELLPWSVKTEGLLREQYAAVGAASRTVFPAALEGLRAAQERGIEVADLLARNEVRADDAKRFVEAYRRYCWPVDGLDGVKLAPFQVLATEGASWHERDHAWHLSIADRLVDAAPTLFQRTRRLDVDTTSEASRAEGVSWWEESTEAGGEGMVVKPWANLVRVGRQPAQPGVKVRGREYLRIIYGPDYTVPENIARLRDRNLGLKRSLAIREYSLGLEAIRRTVEREPLWRVHEAVFGVLALESEPVDPRL